MINANELRIGNWVTELIKNRIVSIDGIEPNQGFVWVNYLNGFSQYKVGINDIEPIPLTPEILEKCGFKKDNDGIYSKLGFMFWIDDIGVMQLALNYSPICNAPCKYVHQLQNLIHALTGEEITFKP